jgi:hypothetical protein
VTARLRAEQGGDGADPAAHLDLDEPAGPADGVRDPGDAVRELLVRDDPVAAVERRPPAVPRETVGPRPGRREGGEDGRGHSGIT